MCVDCFDGHSPYIKFHGQILTCHCTTSHGTRLVCKVAALYIYKYKKSFLLNEGGYRDGKL